jgi:hypothetical protein
MGWAPFVSWQPIFLDPVRHCPPTYVGGSYYKTFWEELISYYPWYDTGHIENDASNNSSIAACVFVTAVTFLPSWCLATIRIFTEPLPSNDKDFYRAVA